MKNENILNQIEKYILYIVLFLVPIAVFPASSSPLVISKIFSLVLFLIVLVTIKAFRIALFAPKAINIGTFDIPSLVFFVAFLVGTLATTPNKLDAILFPGTTTVFVGASLVYFFVNQLKEIDKKKIESILFTSATVVAIFSLLSVSGVLSAMSFLPSWAKDTSFNPAGGALPASIFLIAILPIAISVLLSAREAATKVLSGVAVSVIFFGLVASLVTIFAAKGTAFRLPDFNTSWVVAIDSMKENPLFGSGPGDYLSAFNQFRPISYNSTDIWSMRFGSARNMYLTIFTELGFSGALAVILLLIAAAKRVKEEVSDEALPSWGFPVSAKLVSLVCLLILFAIFPSQPVTIFLLFVLLSLNSKVHKVNFNISSLSSEQNTREKIPSVVVSLPLFLAVIFLSYHFANAFWAEYKYKTAIDAISRNDGRAAYDLTRSAIASNLYVDRYRITYAQLNLALANGIAENNKDKLTDQDRTTITQLIEQAIREGKAAVSLNPKRAGNWEVLANIYRSVMPLASGADQFAVQTYNQAVILDPLNAQTRTALGGILFSLKAYDQAIDAYRLAISVKPDYANAHYNLALAYREKNDIQKAIASLETVLSLVPKDSEDFILANKTLEEIKSKLPSKEADSDAESLTPPPSSDQIIAPPLELGSEATPPAVLDENSSEDTQ